LNAISLANTQEVARTQTQQATETERRAFLSVTGRLDINRNENKLVATIQIRNSGVTPAVWTQGEHVVSGRTRQSSETVQLDVASQLIRPERIDSSISSTSDSGTQMRSDRTGPSTARPIKKAREVYRDGGRRRPSVLLTVKQTQTVDDVTPLFETPVEIELATRNSTVIRRNFIPLQMS
jgi:hypothetical protein